MQLLRHLLVVGAALTAITGAAYAADLSIPAQLVPEVAPVSSWDGFYAGIFAGYSAGTISATDPSLNPVTNSVDYSGYQLGVAAGYNFHMTDTIVGGLQGDIAWNNASGSDLPNSYSTDLNWTGSLTGRIGADINGIVPYLLGGVAFTNSGLTDNGGGGLAQVTDIKTHIGYTVGAGIEFALADHLSANVEYRYSDYGGEGYTLTNPTYDVNQHDNAVRVGLNYHMN